MTHSKKITFKSYNIIQVIFGDSGSMLTLQNLKLTIACYYIKTLSQLSNAFTHYLKTTRMQS